jgi:hypothetical protein
VRRSQKPGGRSTGRIFQAGATAERKGLSVKARLASDELRRGG